MTVPSGGAAASGGGDDGRTGTAEVRLERTALGDTLVLDHRARRNALTLPMWRRLGELAREAGDGTAPLYVLGAGGYFSSGADLDSLRHARTSEERAVGFVHAVVRCLLSLHTSYREVVAVVEGGAAGGGVEIMAACDRRVAVGAPALVFPFGHHGMTLDGFTRWRLDQLVGGTEAARLTDGRHVVDAGEAQALGLFDARVGSVEELVAEERRRLTAADAPPTTRGPRYAEGPADLDAAVRRASVPMLTAFPPHTAPVQPVTRRGCR